MSERFSILTLVLRALQSEYEAVEEIIEKFKAGRISMTRHASLALNNRPIKYTDLPKEKQKNFDIQRLVREAEKYLSEVVPNLKENWSSK